MFKATNKGTRMMSREMFWVSHVKTFNSDFYVFVCRAIILLPFCWKSPSFWKRLHNINLKKYSDKKRRLKIKLKIKFKIQI